MRWIIEECRLKGGARTTYNILSASSHVGLIGIVKRSEDRKVREREQKQAKIEVNRGRTRNRERM